VHTILDLWASRAPTTASPPKAPLPGQTFRRPSVLQQTWVQLRRSALLSVRDPMLYMGRGAMFLLVGVFLAVVYIQCRDRVQEQVCVPNSAWAYAIFEILRV
jgi:hypothetical protein